MTYPAAAMSMKSCSVIHESQWFFRAERAVLPSWYWANVHSSTIALTPVLSKRLGVIHGYRKRLGMRYTAHLRAGRHI